MESIEYYNLNLEQKKKFLNFLNECGQDIEHKAYENMWDESWENKSNTLLYILEKTDRFRINGFYQILFDNKEVVACGGAYQSNFSKDLAILGTRTWIHKDRRNELLARNYLLPVQKSWAIDNGFKAVALTFNEYNKNLLALWQRKRLGDQRTPIQPHNFGFKFHIVEFPVNVQHTKQWVIYEKLDDNYDFDWKSIEYKD